MGELSLECKYPLFWKKIIIHTLYECSVSISLNIKINKPCRAW